MSPEEAVRARIVSLAAVTALASDRVYMLKVDQDDDMPAVRVQLVGEQYTPHLRGGGGVRRARVQVDAFAAESSGADPYANARALADAINGDGSGSGLDGWRGTVNGTTVQGILRVDRAVSYEAEELRLVRVRQDYFVWAE